MSSLKLFFTFFRLRKNFHADVDWCLITLFNANEKTNEEEIKAGNKDKDIEEINTERMKK